VLAAIRLSAQLSRCGGYLDKDILQEFGNIPVKEITPKHCADLPDFPKALECSTGRKQTVITMKLCLLTASRPGFDYLSHISPISAKP